MPVDNVVEIFLGWAAVESSVCLYPQNLNQNRIFKKCFRDAATTTAKNKSWRVLIKPKCVSDFPRAAAVAEFRLLSGHDCLCAQLYRFNLTHSPFCVLCASGQVMDAGHLDVCSAFKS
ncbi:uncharacterized protein TNCV_2989271 [Trichonephila clavipes]|nr:uncharacterized protein TNCV_2989271 [Trichonephila clavipes]